MTDTEDSRLQFSRRNRQGDMIAMTSCTTKHLAPTLGGDSKLFQMQEAADECIQQNDGMVEWTILILYCMKRLRIDDRATVVKRISDLFGRSGRYLPHLVNITRLLEDFPPKHHTKEIPNATISEEI